MNANFMNYLRVDLEKFAVYIKINLGNIYKIQILYRKLIW